LSLHDALPIFPPDARDASERGQTPGERPGLGDFRLVVDRRIHVDYRLAEGTLSALQEGELPKDFAALRRVRVRLQASLRLDEMAECLRVLLPTALDGRDLAEEPRGPVGPTIR